MVCHVVGEDATVDIIRRFSPNQWSHVQMPIIHPHKEGYFIMQFHSWSDYSNIPNKGSYFLNRAPVVVKKWSTNFDFKAYILRVIGVSLRMPSLPLHCWGKKLLVG